MLGIIFPPFPPSLILALTCHWLWLDLLVFVFIPVSCSLFFVYLVFFQYFFTLHKQWHITYKTYFIDVWYQRVRCLYNCLVCLLYNGSGLLIVYYFCQFWSFWYVNIFPFNFALLIFSVISFISEEIFSISVAFWGSWLIRVLPLPHRNSWGNSEHGTALGAPRQLCHCWLELAWLPNASNHNVAVPLSTARGPAWSIRSFS